MGIRSKNIEIFARLVVNRFLDGGFGIQLHQAGAAVVTKNFGWISPPHFAWLWYSLACSCLGLAGCCRSSQQ